MNKYLNFLLVLSVFISIIACEEDKENASERAFLGGEIVNPVSEYLVLTRNNKVIDTIYLNEENRFNYHVSNVDPGIFILQHGAENQVIHISPGDSILIRANTLDFDHSLHFSGAGAEKNNFLINTLLLNEANTDMILNYYRIPPEEFAQKTDSIREVRMQTLRSLNEKHEFSENFLKIAQKNIRYDYFDMRERYTFLLNKYYQEYADLLTPEFHEYREEINFNEEDLISSPGYTRLIENYIINKSIADCLEEASETEKRECHNLNSISHLKRRINFIGSLTNLPLLKEYFYKKWGAQAMTMGKSREELLSVIKLLTEKDLTEEEILKLRILGSIQLAFLPGISLENTPLISTSGDTIPISEVVNKPTVVFIWSVDAPVRHQKEHEKINEYRVKYPEVNFIGLNIDMGETGKWLQTIKENGYRADKEFQLDQIEIGDTVLSKELLQYYLNKLLFLDSTGKVIIGDAFLFSPEFESKILELLNR